MWSPISPGVAKAPRRGRGFTLLEVLVAMVILAVVLTAAYRVFSSSYSAYRHIDPDGDLFHTARIILDRMTDEIQSAYYEPDLEYTGFIGESHENGDAPWDTLSFSSMANFYWIERVEGIKQSDFLKISYTVAEDDEEEGKSQLIRRQDPALRSFKTEGDGIETESDSVHQLADNIWGLDFRYFDGTEWVEEWNTSETKALPHAVEVKLILQSDEGKRVPFYAVIPIEAL